MFFSILSDFGNCNKIISLGLIKFWHNEQNFKFPAFGNNKILSFDLHFLFIYFN